MKNIKNLRIARLIYNSEPKKIVITLTFPLLHFWFSNCQKKFNRRPSKTFESTSIFWFTYDSTILVLFIFQKKIFYLHNKNCVVILKYFKHQNIFPQLAHYKRSNTRFLPEKIDTMYFKKNNLITFSSLFCHFKSY